jgi:histidinol-phosphate aminotransferase
MSIKPKKNILDLFRIPNSNLNRADFLRLDKNENLIGFSEDVINDIKSIISSDFITAYPETGLLYQKLSENLGLDSSQFYLSSGSDAGIKSVFEVYVNPGDEVLVIDPTYAMYYIYADMFQGRLVKVSYERDFTLSVDKIINSISSKTKLVCIANPNSPTGTFIPMDDLQQVIKMANRHGAIALIDEAYYHYCEKTAIGLLKNNENLIITRTFSKALGIASARLGFVISNPSIIANLFKVRPMYEVNSFAVQLGIYFLEHSEIVGDHINQVSHSKIFLKKELLQDGLSIQPSFTNFVLIDVGNSEKSKRIVQLLFDEKIIIKGGFKEPCLESYIRVGIGSIDQMRFFVKELRIVLEKINNKSSN